MPDEGKFASRREASGRTADWGAFLSGSQEAYARWLETMVEFSQEIARFAQDRWQEDMAAWASLAGCHNPQEAMACQRQFSAKAAAQYSEEIGKLLQMMTRMAGAGFFSPLQPRKSAGV